MNRHPVREGVDLHGVVDHELWEAVDLFAASPPRSAIAVAQAARSTIAGTPVKSWWITRPGVKEISREGSSSHPLRDCRTCSSVEVRRTFSSRIFSV